jgi:Rrf2 family protein
MEISTKCRYGTKAIIEIARNYKIRPTTRKDIIANQNIPDSYLENILIDLKKNGLVNSIRGAKGGFELNKAPEEITLFDIFTTLRKSLCPVECVQDPNVCCCTEYCITRPIWEKMYKAQEEILMSFSIKDLLNEYQDNKCHKFSFC